MQQVQYVYYNEPALKMKNVLRGTLLWQREANMGQGNCAQVNITSSGN